MNQPALYVEVNDLQRTGVKKFMNEFGHFIQWRKDGCDSLIDVGSGTGDALMETVYPLLPENFDKIVVSDISPNMVNYAKECFGWNERVDFKILDIGTTDALPPELCESFDHFTSFCSLHWVHNQKQAMQNIYQLLRPNSDCLLMTPVNYFTYDWFDVLVHDEKWSKYLPDHQKIMSPLHHCADPVGRFAQLTEQAGFIDCKFEYRKVDYIFDSRQMFFNFVKSVGILFERVPVAEHENLFEDMIRIAKDKNFELCQFIADSEDNFKVNTPYTYVMVYGRKPSEFMKNEALQEPSRQI